MDELEKCQKYDKDEDECCEHLKAVLLVMRQQNVSPAGDVQVCALQCDTCKKMHGF